MRQIQETEKEILMVGRTPIFESEENVLTRFIYTFEFSFMTEPFDDKRENLEKWFKEQTKALPYEWESLSKEQQWWGYVFILSKEVIAYEGLSYATTVCESTILNLPSKEEDVLELIANHFVFGVASKTMKTPLIRPLEFVNLEVSLDNNDIFSEILIEVLPVASSYLKKHYKQREINEDFMKTFWLSNKKYVRKYASVWEAFAEININMIFVLYGAAINSRSNTSKMERETILKNVVRELFGTSFLEFTEIDHLVEYCVEVLLEVTYDKYFE